MRKSGVLYYMASDHLGGTAVVMNGTDGTLVSRVRYYPYGTVWTQEGGAPPTDKLFTGYQREGAISGLYYASSRFYSADVGRFLSPDSMAPDAGDPQALNRYSYVLNNPLTYADPSGTYPIDASGEPLVDLRHYIPPSLLPRADHLYVSSNPPMPREVRWIADGDDELGEKETGCPSYMDCLGMPFAKGGGGGSLRAGGTSRGITSASEAPLERIHGNSLSSTRTTRLYQLRDATTGRHLKFGITSEQNPYSRYTQAELEGKEVSFIDSGTRAGMFAAERWLTERFPGPLNREPWAGANWGKFPFFAGLWP